MKKLSIIILLAAIACRKQAPKTEQQLTRQFIIQQVDCKNCMAYADTAVHNGFIINPAVFCANYCVGLRKLGGQ